MYSLKHEDKQYAVRMQTVAGGKHAESGRSRYSSWMKAGLQKGGKKHQGAGRAGSFNSSEEIQKPLHNTTLPQKYEQHLKGVPWVSILIQEGTWGLFQLKEKLIFFLTAVLVPFLQSSQCHHSHTLTSPGLVGLAMVI